MVAASEGELKAVASSIAGTATFAHRSKAKAGNTDFCRFIRRPTIVVGFIPAMELCSKGGPDQISCRPPFGGEIVS
jgi:hypothetical protein